MAARGHEVDRVGAAPASDDYRATASSRKTADPARSGPAASRYDALEVPPALSRPSTRRSLQAQVAPRALIGISADGLTREAD